MAQSKRNRQVARALKKAMKQERKLQSQARREEKRAKRQEYKAKKRSATKTIPLNPVSQLLEKVRLPIPDKDTAELKKYKQRLKKLIAEANNRVYALKESNLPSYALYKAQQDRVQGDRIKEFDIDNIHNMEDLKAEAIRARTFINDETSTIFGAQRIKEQDSFMRWVGEFGSAFAGDEYENKNYNIYVLRDDVAKVAFASYRRLEELASARLSEYGSEFMIAYMYDVAYESGFTDPTNLDDLNELAISGYDFLDRQLGVQDYKFTQKFERKQDLGYVVDYLFDEKWKGVLR